MTPAPCHIYCLLSESKAYDTDDLRVMACGSAAVRLVERWFVDSTKTLTSNIPCGTLVYSQPIQ